MERHASALVSLGIPTLAALVAVLFVWGAARVHRSTLAAAGVVAWFALAGALAGTGVLARFDLRPPPIAPFMVVVLGVGVAVGVSPLGRRLADGWPLAVLVGVQAFRLPLELVMHQAAVEGVMPPQMTYTGWNFDIVTGTLAIPVAWLVARGRAPRALVVAWNALGFATLALVVVVAGTSMPFIAAFGNDPAHLNTWVTELPFVYLPAGPVVFALAGHIVVARKLRATSPASFTRPVLARS